MAEALRLWQALSPRERSVLVRAWLAFPVAAASMRVSGFRRVRDRAIEAFASQPRREDPDAARAVARLVAAAARRSPVRPACLTRSLVLLRLLRRAGLAADLRIGVNRHRGELAAHAWVEHAGLPLGEPEEIALRFLPLDRDPVAEER